MFKFEDENLKELDPGELRHEHHQAGLHESFPILQFQSSRELEEDLSIQDK